MCFVKLLVVFVVVEFQGSVRSLNSPFKCNVIYTLCRLHLLKRELCTTPQFASSCVAPRRKLTIACGRITNFPSCTARSVAIVPLDHDL